MSPTRFVSKYGRFGVQLRPLIQEAYATGMAKIVQEPIYAFFHPMKLLPHERELAIATWSFNGSYQEQDEVTIVPPDYRIGLFDSEEGQAEYGWSDDVRIWVEEQLTDLAFRFGDMAVVPLASLAPPWPRYDEYRGSPAALVRKLIDEGHRLEDVLTYEMQVQKRQPIIDAIEQAFAEDEALQEEVVG